MLNTCYHNNNYYVLYVGVINILIGRNHNTITAATSYVYTVIVLTTFNKLAANIINKVNAVDACSIVDRLLQ